MVVVLSRSLTRPAPLRRAQPSPAKPSPSRCSKQKAVRRLTQCSPSSVVRVRMAHGARARSLFKWL